MLWTKSWLETRWRFLIGFALVLCSAAGTVFVYPQVVKLMPLVPANMGGQLGERIRESAELARTFNGYIWAQWFRQNLAHLATLFAILLGTAGLLSESGGALFTLSLPVSRKRLAGVRAAAGLGELFVLAFAPSLLLVMLSPAIGEHYGIINALTFSTCLFIAATLFFALAFLLSTFFDDPWRPSLIALAVAFALAMIEQLARVPGVFSVMSGEAYFRSGHLPWLGLLITASIAAFLYHSATSNLLRRDF